MANKKGKRAYNKSKKKKATTKMDMMVVGIIILSILLAVLIYTKSGFVGNKLHEVLGGMFGIMEYIIPIGTFILGIKLACEDRNSIGTKLACKW